MGDHHLHLVPQVIASSRFCEPNYPLCGTNYLHGQHPTVTTTEGKKHSVSSGRTKVWEPAVYIC